MVVDGLFSGLGWLRCCVFLACAFRVCHGIYTRNLSFYVDPNVDHRC